MINGCKTVECVKQLSKTKKIIRYIFIETTDMEEESQ